MNKAPLFFIAVLPPEDLQREVTSFKHFIAEKWGPRHALNSPPHLTIQPPFPWPERNLGQLKNCLAGFASRQSSFTVELSGFGAFPPRVIFIKPLKNRKLEKLFQDLVSCMAGELNFSDPRNRRPFHPHMTIAHRDLDERDFPEMWSFFREKIFEREFQVDALALLRNVQGKWEVEDRYPFAQGTV